MVTREKEKIERKEKKQKQKMHILFYPKVYYANTFHPILTYINDATKFGLDYEMEKEQPTTLCMCHDPRGLRCLRRCHMGALPLSAKVK